MASQQNKYPNVQEPIQENQHLNGFLPEHFCRAPKFVLHLDGTLMAFCQNTTSFMGESTQMAFSQNTFYPFLIFVIFWCQDGSGPNLIVSYERAFHKDSESGLNSKMVISTQIGYSQNRAAVRLHSCQNSYQKGPFLQPLHSQIKPGESETP